MSLAFVHGLAWVLLVLACGITPRAWQDRPAGVSRLKWRERIKNWSLGGPAQRREYRSRLLDRNAFFWLVARDRLKPAYVWIFLAVCGLLWLWGALEFRRDWMEEAIFIATAFLLNCILKNWVANEAVRQLSEDRKMGSLELLLSTPLTVEEMMRGQALALWRQFFWPVVLVLMAEVAMLIAASGNSYSSSTQAFRVCFWLAGMIMLVADVFALYWVGMWLGLAAKNPKRAFSGAVGRVLALPWVTFVVLITLIGLVALAGQYRGSGPSPGFLLGIWFVLGLAADLGFGLWARQNLLTRFREVATQRFQQRPSLWKSWFGSRN